MLKVFIIGYDEPHAVVGKFVWEDERYLHLDDGGKKIKIPNKRIAYIEDWSEISGEVQPTAPLSRPRAPVAQQTTTDSLEQTFEPKDPASIVKSIKDIVAKKFADNKDITRVTQVEPEDLQEYNVDQAVGPKVEILLMFSGVKEGRYPLQVPANEFDGVYTPSLGRLIFSNPAIQSFMSGDIMLEGLPTVTGKTFEFRVKNSRTIGDITNKVDVLGKMLSIGATGMLNDTQRKSPFDNGFSMPKSPFDQVPDLLSAPLTDVED